MADDERTVYRYDDFPELFWDANPRRRSIEAT